MTNERGKSDRSIEPAKSPNKAEGPAAEAMKGRERSKRSRGSRSVSRLDIRKAIQKNPRGLESVNGVPMRSLRQTLCTLAAILVLLTPPFALQSPPSSLSQSPSATSSSTKPNQVKPNCTSNGSYVNSKGQTVPRPENCSAPPKGATAQCRDSTYSFSKSHRGTCSHHGGVAKWL